ncbi:hypothetical protein HAX54_008224 [Datura stramonium]|uniref:Uncharacterized protein n=1 Tax=Datura stramonium TaxID=4076 RepID=A0ABS8TFL0_DATST|nr:hypothetical protein [Datura stramonium]
MVVLGAEVVGMVGNYGKCSGTDMLKDGNWGGGLLMLRGGGEIKEVNLSVFYDGSSKFYLITHKYGVRPPHVPNFPSVDHLMNFGSQDRAFISGMTAVVDVIHASLILISRVTPRASFNGVQYPQRLQFLIIVEHEMTFGTRR